MIVRNFLSWAQTANAAQRAEGAGALARAYLYTDLEPQERRAAEIALMSLLDDPSPLVRRALADNFASAVDAPHAIVSALASDQSDIAAPVLSRSPLLTEAELIDCAAIGDAFAQSAIALRARVPAGVCAALAEVGAREAAISLAVNPGADLPEFSMRRMIERFGDDGEMREALLARPWLPATVRNDLVKATAAALSAFVVDCGWMTNERAERLSREERDKANVIIVTETAERDGRHGVRELVSHLRASQQLTASLVLRALLSGNRDLFEAALVELSGLRAEKVAGLLRDFRGAGFAALYSRAGLPEKFLPAFRAALEAQHEYGDSHAGETRLSLMMIERVLTACDEINGGELDRLMALLRRFEMEAALDDARLEAARIAAEAQAPEVAAPAAFSGVPARSAPLIDLAAFEAELMQIAA
ncbi:DUF2336 domain-containing protein [Methylocystis sp. MJC1]|jgi:uncharacterized protein (DUF2336 family)|uniref:DUF2336 domain-containing protein n=1 Tax=Methylocystis sp. MJC1 TaxID=2654282 RepID=UPI0013EC714B|nr:DUF2336 domain-containing protein [Methylocystis sp. MJC1]KAF2990294.1 hypothetical protein MJC1_02689 [Methylocystis sp. MJC1]MBU6528010.1 DUF2336 domain-containing protein [Methylocystis sp. MJC1]UZX10929.1 DUF2336 domain-containing protein [Methylocystis sp. MJC1]